MALASIVAGAQGAYNSPILLLYSTLTATSTLLLPSSQTIRRDLFFVSLRITIGAVRKPSDFYSRDTGKSQVVVQHSKLLDAKDAARKKAFWSKALESLKTLLELIRS